MEDHDFTVVRKNLNILSVLIFLLAFSNAQINQINFLGIDITLDGGKVYICIHVLYLYFIWRYYTKLDYQAFFLGKLRYYLFESLEGVKSKFKPRDIGILDVVFLGRDDYRKLKEASDLVFIDFKPLEFQKIRSKVSFSLSYSSEETHGDRFNHELYIDYSIGWRFLIWKVCSFLFKKDKFGDYLFPFIPVVTNLGFFLFSWKWQGSLYKLLGF